MIDPVKILIATCLAMAALLSQGVLSQPSFTGWTPDGTVIEDAALRRSQYLERVNEVIDWRIAFASQNLAGMDLRSNGGFQRTVCAESPARDSKNGCTAQGGLIGFPACQPKPDN
jgi:hypothetical protein